MFQVSLLLNIQDIIILLPREINDCRAAIRVGLPELQLALSVHDYYMGTASSLYPSTLYSLSATARDDIKYPSAAILRNR
jgi:BLTP1 N-terminal region